MTAAGAPFLQMRFTAADLPKLRLRVGDAAGLAGLEEQRCEELVMAAYELACNAVQRAGSGDLRLSRMAGFLRCQVSDDAPGFGSRAAADSGGLWLAQELADRIEIDSGADGAVVTLLVQCRAKAG